MLDRRSRLSSLLASLSLVAAGCWLAGCWRCCVLRRLLLLFAPLLSIVSCLLCALLIAALGGLAGGRYRTLAASGLRIPADI
jgi:hypothetical protein